MDPTERAPNARSHTQNALATLAASRSQVPKLLAKFDRDQDGRLNLDEFDALARRLVLRCARRTGAALRCSPSESS